MSSILDGYLRNEFTILKQFYEWKVVIKLFIFSP